MKNQALFDTRKNFVKELRVYGIQKEIPNITDTNAKFLRDLIKIKKVKNMLEIGTANGFSAIQFGFELEKTGGKLLSIEFSSPSYNKALDNIQKVKLENTISLINGNALDEIPKLSQMYDFVFIDGMKRRTVDFLSLIWDKVEKNGIIIIDDVIKFKEKMVGLGDYLKKNNIGNNIIPIDIDDGIMMIIKN